MHVLSVILWSLYLTHGLVQAQTAGEVIESAAVRAVEAGFTELERQLIRRYLGGEPAGQTRSGIVFNNATLQKQREQRQLPAGLQKKPLPPGLAAQLQRNGTLPPGLSKKALPADLERQLPPVRPGYERSILDDLTVVLIETATNRIIDIIFDTVAGEADAKSRERQ